MSYADASSFADDELKSSSSGHDPRFKKMPNVTQYKGADWKNEITRKSGISLGDAFHTALSDDSISYFFYMNGSMYLEGNNGPDGWTEKGAFNPGDAVFFSGEPWYGSSYASDAYEKIAVEKKITYSGFQAELAEGKDHLNIMPDVQAFANLISSRELKPPLSVGLFGDWGSGKSFFMNLLKKEVEENVVWMKKQIQEESNHLFENLREADQPVEVIKKLLPSPDSQVELIMEWIRQKPSSAYEKLVRLSLKPAEIRQDLANNKDVAKKKIKEKLALNLENQANKLAEGLSSNHPETAQILQQLVAGKAERSLGYCRNVSQIEFNAWHYVDSNLWASMLNNIFEKLSQFIGILPQEEFNTIELFKGLASTKELMDETAKEKKRLEDSKQKINTNLDELKLQREKVRTELKGISISQIWGQLKEDTEVKSTLSQVQSLVNEAGKELGFEPIKVAAAENRSRIEVLYQRYQSSRSRLTTLWVELKTMTTKEKALLLVFLGIPILALLSLPLLESAGSIPANWVSSISKITALIYSLLKFIPSLLNKGEQAFKKIDKGLDRLSAAREKVNQLENIAASQVDIQIQLKLQELSQIEAQEKEIQEKLTSLEQQLIDTEVELEAIKKGQRLSSFIQRRLSSDDYQKHLGLISTIRDDFEKLTDYLHSRDPISELLSTVSDNRIQPFQLEPVNKIDRIILYIDDLDRCPPEKVVEVLQAIHLILAFPLFVVVVGVDVRWISKSLIKQYGTMLAPVDQFDTEELASDTAYNLKYKGNATPYDYLEKIFQIPFRLQAMDEEGKTGYIGKLLEGDIEKDESEANTAPTTATTQDTDASITAPSDNPPNESAPPTPPNLTLERAKLDKKDLHFIQSLSPILSNSPRALKRFANICRLIKSHEVWGVEVNSFRVLSAYQCRVFLMALITGLPHLAHKIFDWLEDWAREIEAQAKSNNNAGIEPEEGSLKRFLTYVQTEKISQESEPIRENWTALSRFLNSPPPIHGEDLGEGAKTIDLLQDWPVREILDLTHTISRFSFRFEHY